MGVGAGLYMCDVVKKFTFAISSPDEFLFDLSKWWLYTTLDFRNSKFYQPIRLRGSQCINIPNFMVICQTFAELWRFNGCSKWRLSPSWILKTGILTANMGERVNVHHCAKFCGNRSNRSWDMAIFQYFQNGDRPPSWICYEHVWTTH